MSNHAHVLVCVARDPDLRLRDLAELVQLTERQVINIVGDLEEAGVLSKTREGRRNHYELATKVALRHPLEADRTVGELLRMLLDRRDARRLGLRG